jgi:hypothetical protein
MATNKLKRNSDVFHNLAIEWKSQHTLKEQSQLPLELVASTKKARHRPGFGVPYSQTPQRVSKSLGRASSSAQEVSHRNRAVQYAKRSQAICPAFSRIGRTST